MNAVTTNNWHALLGEIITGDCTIVQARARVTLAANKAASWSWATKQAEIVNGQLDGCAMGGVEVYLCALSDRFFAESCREIHFENWRSTALSAAAARISGNHGLLLWSAAFLERLADAARQAESVF